MPRPKCPYEDSCKWQPRSATVNALAALKTHLRVKHYPHNRLEYVHDKKTIIIQFKRKLPTDVLYCKKCTHTEPGIKEMGMHYTKMHLGGKKVFNYSNNKSPAPKSPKASSPHPTLQPLSPSLGRSQQAPSSSNVVDPLPFTPPHITASPLDELNQSLFTPPQDDVHQSLFTPPQDDFHQSLFTPPQDKANQSPFTLQRSSPVPLSMAAAHSPSAFQASPQASSTPLQTSRPSTSQPLSHPPFSLNSPPHRVPLRAAIPQTFFTMQSPSPIRGSGKENRPFASTASTNIHHSPSSSAEKAQNTFLDHVSDAEISPEEDTLVEESEVAEGSEVLDAVADKPEGDHEHGHRPRRAAAKTSYLNMEYDDDVMDVDVDDDVEDVNAQPSCLEDDGEMVMMDKDLAKALHKANLAYISLEPVGVLVCTDCEKAIIPKSSIKHATKEHDLSLSKEEKKLICEWYISFVQKGLLACKGDEIHYDKFPPKPPPFLHVAVQTGLGCAYGRCKYVTTSERMIQNHWKEQHKDRRAVQRWELSCEVKMQSFFNDNKVWFKVWPSLASRPADDPYVLYLNTCAPWVTECTTIGAPPANTLEVPVLLKMTRWDKHLEPYTPNAKSIIRLLSLMDPPAGRKAEKTWLGKALQRTVLKYYDITLHQGLNAPLKIRKLLRSDKQLKERKNNPWNPLDKHGTRLRYARLVYVFAYALLSTIDGHRSGYSFPLTEEDKANAAHLKAVLTASGCDSEEEDGDEEDEGAEDEYIEVDADTIDNADMEDLGKNKEDDVDLGEVIDDDADEDGIDGEDFVLPIDFAEDKSDPDIDMQDQLTSAEEFNIDDEGGLVDAFHKFIKPFLYPRGDSQTNKGDKWQHPVERLLALRHLKYDGTYKDAKLTTGTFAIVHYHVRATAFYEGMRKAKLGLFGGNTYRAVASEFAESAREDVICAYSICAEYQEFASALARNPNNPPTTRVSDDCMNITHRESTLNIPSWRKGLHQLASEAESELKDLCYDEEFGLDIPEQVRDDWANLDRGYSWLSNGTFMPDNLALLDKMLNDRSLKLTTVVSKKGHPGKLLINIAAMKRILKRCDALNEKIALLALFTSGLIARITQFLEHKFTNGWRARTLLLDLCSLWLVIRRSKTESMTMREAFVPAKCHPMLTKLLQKYLLIVRPLEMQLAYHVYGKSSVRQYKEYLWMKDGERMQTKWMYSLVEKFMSEYCKAPGMGVQQYRQIVVEIGRVYLGSEAEVQFDRNDLIDAQMNHSSRIANNEYALEADQLPRMSSTLLSRYGAVSEAWWEVTGFMPGKPPLAPLAVRRKAERQLIPTVKESMERMEAEISDLRQQLATERQERKEASQKLEDNFKQVLQTTLTSVIGRFTEGLNQQLQTQQLLFEKRFDQLEDHYKKNKVRLTGTTRAVKE